MSCEKTEDGVRVDKAVGERLRSIRERHGLSMRAVSVALRMGRNHLSSIEAGKTAASLRVLLKLAEHYNVRLSRIVREVEDTLGYA